MPEEPEINSMSAKMNVILNDIFFGKKSIPSGGGELTLKSQLSRGGGCEGKPPLVMPVFHFYMSFLSYTDLTLFGLCTPIFMGNTKEN